MGHPSRLKSALPWSYLHARPINTSLNLVTDGEAQVLLGTFLGHGTRMSALSCVRYPLLAGEDLESGAQ